MSTLCKSPFLSYQAYKESVTRQVHHETIYLTNQVMRLDLEDLNDESFIFLCESQHALEAIRCIQSHKLHRISHRALQYAFSSTIDRLNGDPNLIAALLKVGNVDPSLKIKHFTDPLIWAAEKGVEHLVKMLLEDPRIKLEGQDYLFNRTVHFQSFNRNRAIHVAAEHGHRAVVKTLMNHSGIDIKALGFMDRTIIHSASLSNSPKMMSHLLMATDINPALPDVEGLHPLHIAAQYGNYKVISILVNDPRVEVNARNHKNQTPLSTLLNNILRAGIDEESAVNAAKSLLDHKDINIDLGVDGNNLRHPIYIICRCGFLRLFKLLGQRGICDNICVKLAYEVAVKWGSNDIAQYLNLAKNHLDYN
jgi:ankyrin repeat protein